MGDAYTGLVGIVIEIADIILSIYGILVFAWVISSWLIAFNVINSYQPFVRTVLDFLFRITQPALRPIQRYVSPINGIDVSPFILLLGIYVLRRLLWAVIYPLLIPGS